MRVLAINTFNDRSEAALWRGLVKGGVSVDMMCDAAAPERDALEAAGIAVSPIAVKHRLDLRAAAQIRRKLLSQPYDIVHVTRNRELSVSIIASRGASVKLIAYRGTIGHISRLDPASWLTYLNPRIDKIICNSHAVRSHLSSLGLPDSRLATIYKGFDPAWYKPAERSALAEIGIPPEVIAVGFAGDMRPIKGVDTLLRASDRLADESRIHLLLVGRVRDKRLEPLAAKSRMRDRIHFVGFKENAPSLMGACDIFVMPSLGREGLTKAVIEAMAQGVPAIVSDAGGLPEIVENEKCGLIVPPGNPEALGRAIANLASDAERRKAFGAAAKERIQTVFGANRAIESVLRLYEEVLAWHS